jgi:transcriptional regulator with XRE-family HTH domain
MPTRGLTAADIHVGQSIRAHRLMARMSQAELGDVLGVSFQQVQKYEKGVNRISAGRLLQLAKIFRVPIATFYEANADFATVKPGVTAAPVKLMSDQGAVRLLASYTEISDRGIRRGITQLADLIAKAWRKHQRQAKQASRAA